MKKQEIIREKQLALEKLSQSIGCKKNDSKDMVPKMYIKKIQNLLKSEGYLKNIKFNEKALCTRKLYGEAYGKIILFFGEDIMESHRREINRKMRNNIRKAMKEDAEEEMRKINK